MPYGVGTYAFEASQKRWKPLKHLIIVIELLIFLVQGKLNRLMIFMPPRHGKSELISKYFLSWYLGTFLEKRAILTSYGAGFAAKWGRETRDLLNYKGYEMFLSDVLIRNDSKASHKWDIKDHKGGLVTAGAGGPIMGEGANLFIIDDPHKNIDEARSPTFQEKVWEWYLSIARERVEKDLEDGLPGSMIYIAQRLDVMDLAGQILEAEPYILMEDALEILRSGGSIPLDTWVLANFPLVAEEEDILGREPGDTLWPQRVDKAEAQRKKNIMGEQRFNAIHQGNPREREGKYFKTEFLEIVDTLPNNIIQEVQWSDLAATHYPPNVPVKQRGAATATVRLGLTEDRRLFITFFDEMWEEEDIVTTNIINIARSRGNKPPTFRGKTPKYCIPIDPGQASRGQVKKYSLLLPGFNFEGVIESGSKEDRAEAPSTWAKINKVYVYREGAGPKMTELYGSKEEALKRFIKVVTDFPNNKHKDFVDAFSGAFSELEIPEEEEKKKTWVVMG